MKITSQFPFPTALDTEAEVGKPQTYLVRNDFPGGCSGLPASSHELRYTIRSTV